MIAWSGVQRVHVLVARPGEMGTGFEPGSAIGWRRLIFGSPAACRSNRPVDRRTWCPPFAPFAAHCRRKQVQQQQAAICTTCHSFGAV